MDTIKIVNNIQPPAYNENNYQISDDDITEQLKLINIAENNIIDLLAINITPIKNNYIKYLYDKKIQQLNPEN